MHILRSDFLHPVPQEIEAAHAPLDLSAYIQPGDRLAVKQITMIRQFNKVIIQPWAEPGTELGQLMEAFWKTVERDRDMQETCLRNPPVLKPRPGLLGAVRRGEGQNRLWCRVKVIFLNVFNKLFACSKENFLSTRSFLSWDFHQVVSCTEEDVTVEFLDYGNEAVLYDSQKVAES